MVVVKKRCRVWTRECNQVNNGVNGLSNGYFSCLFTVDGARGEIMFSAMPMNDKYK